MLAKVFHFDELVGHAAQRVRRHRRRGPCRRDNGHPHTDALNIFQKAAEVAIAGEQDGMFDLRREAQHVEGDFHVHVALDAALAGLRVGEFTRQLADDGIAIVIKPVDQRSQRRIFLIFRKSGVIIGADQMCILREIGPHPRIIDIHAECSGRSVEIRSVDKEDSLFPDGIIIHSKQSLRNEKK